MAFSERILGMARSIMVLLLLLMPTCVLYDFAFLLCRTMRCCRIPLAYHFAQWHQFLMSRKKLQYLHMRVLVLLAQAISTPSMQKHILPTVRTHLHSDIPLRTKLDCKADKAHMLADSRARERASGCTPPRHGRSSERRQLSRYSWRCDLSALL